MIALEGKMRLLVVGGEKRRGQGNTFAALLPPQTTPLKAMEFLPDLCYVNEVKVLCHL